MTGGAVSLAAAPWYRRATRWTQLTFVEDDPLHFDRELWRDILRRSQSTAACISAGGYMAFYPTDVPFHHRSRHLGALESGDLFGDVVDDARALDMVIMARIDPHAIHADAAAAHPEWLARDANGDPVPHWSFPDVWLTDPFGTFYSEFVPEITREIVGRYGVDAIFANRWEGNGIISYSEAARRGFFDATGRELPTGDDHTTDGWRAYLAWRSRHLSRQIAQWDQTVRDLRPSASFIPNRGSMLTRDLDPELTKDMYPAFFVDKQGRDLDEPVWVAGRVGKRARGMYPTRQVALITSVGPEISPHRWKDAVSPGPELQSLIVDGFVQGTVPWFTKFNANLFDTRWIEPLVDVYDLHARAGELFGDRPFVADVALLDSVLPDATDPSAAYATDNTAEHGMYQALIEARIPFEILVGDTLTLERMQAFRVIVIPDGRRLPAAHRDLLVAYVASGGSVVADGEIIGTGTGTPDALDDLFGVAATGPVRTGVRNNYIALTDRHPLTEGFAGAQRIIGGTRIVPVQTTTDAGVPYRFVPDYPDVPMEEVYPREPARDPAVVVREHRGGGRTVYLAFDAGAIFWTALQRDHSRLLANAVRWALGGPQRVEVTGEGLVDLSVRADDSGVAVSVVNLDNAHAMRGQLRAFRAIGPQTLSVSAPDGATSARVRTLGGAESVVPVDGGRIEVATGAIELLEVVEIRW